MRFLADECLLGAIVRQLRREGHDVESVPEHLEGANDSRILEQSVADNRVLLTQDYDYGDLAVRLRKPAIGIVIVAEDSFSGSLDEIAVEVAERLGRLGDALIGKLTVLQADRTRHRQLVTPGVESGRK